MKKVFPEYHRLSEKEFQTLWDTCIFAPDASVLLNIYGYSEQTRQEFLTLFENLSPRLRIPHQFALEYHKNRAHAIMEQVKNYARVEKLLDQVYKDELVPKNKHPFLDDKMMKAFRRIQKALGRSRERHEKLFADDPYFNRLTAAFDIVSSPEPEIDKFIDGAKRRYANKVPPGYADLKEKGEPNAYGDLIGWMQLIGIAKAEKKPAILIIDDSKEDWWLIQGDRTIGPRPELIAEFRRECSQQFYMYSSGQFLSFANTYLKQGVKIQAIKEVKERLRKQFESGWDKKAVAPQTPAISDKAYFIPDLPKAEAIKATAPPVDRPKSTTRDK